jgi:hypothetical protein
MFWVASATSGRSRPQGPFRFAPEKHLADPLNDRDLAAVALSRANQ